MKFIIYTLFILFIFWTPAKSQCNCEVINRYDGTVITQCTVLPVSFEDDTQLGTSISYNGRDYYATLTVRYKYTPADLDGNMVLTLVNNYMLNLQHVNSMRSIVGGEEVTQGVFLLTESDIQDLRLSNLKVISFKQTFKPLRHYQVNRNPDVLLKQLDCLIDEGIDSIYQHANSLRENGKRKESKFYYIKYASQSSDNLKSVLDELLFRSNSLINTDPILAYEVYKNAISVNPNIVIYLRNYDQLFEMINQLPAFNPDGFMRTYQINETGETYFIWELAEEASRGGRFGSPNLGLALNLIARGSSVPGEFMATFEEVYYNWKNGLNIPFNICDNITSSQGSFYCQGRESHKLENKESTEKDLLIHKLGNRYSNEVKKAFDATKSFIEEKSYYEEGHGGFGSWKWVNTSNSQNQQLEKYIELVKSIRLGNGPKPVNRLDYYDRELNRVYQSVIQPYIDARRAGKEIRMNDYVVTFEEIRGVQRNWILYRDSNSKLFHLLDPSISEDSWKSMFTKIRIKELNDIPSRIDG